MNSIMKFKEGVLQNLEVVWNQQVMHRMPMTPAHILSMALKDTVLEEDRNLPADFELGWSGLQLLCTTAEAIEHLSNMGQGHFAFEGIGYISFSERMFDNFRQDGAVDIGKNQPLVVTEFVSSIIGSFLPSDSPKSAVVIQLAVHRMEFPAGIIGFQLHIIVPVTEGSWMGLFQIHTQELEAAKLFYAKLKGQHSAEQDIGAALSPTRILN